MKKDKESGSWFEIGDEEARQKAQNRLKRKPDENTSNMVPEQSNGSDGYPNDDPQVGPGNTDSLCRPRSHTIHVISVTLPVDEVVNDLKSMIWNLLIHYTTAMCIYVWSNKQYMASGSYVMIAQSSCGM